MHQRAPNVSPSPPNFQTFFPFSFRKIKKKPWASKKKRHLLKIRRKMQAYRSVPAQKVGRANRIIPADVYFMYNSLKTRSLLSSTGSLRIAALQP